MDNSGNNRESPTKRPMMTDDDRNNNRNRSSVYSSSVHQVLFNDDLLIEILLRLPVISLFFFKSVSKRWLSLITSPAFFNLHVSRFPIFHPPCGFFLQKRKYNDFPSSPTFFNLHINENIFVSLDTRISSGKKKSSAFTFGCFGSDASNVRVLQSCNGLVMCVNWRTNQTDKIYVYNPSVNMFKMLPRVDGLKLDKFSDRMRLAFDPTKSPHYKVLHARVTTPGGDQQPHFIQTQIYSSETGCWRIGDTFPLEWFCGHFDRGVYWNDAIHWLDVGNRVRHFKLDVEHPHDTTTELPKTLDGNSYKELFESRGCLLLACAGDPCSILLEIYEMRNGYSGWSLKYIVNYLHSSIAALLESWMMPILGFRCNVMFMVVGEREEESFVVTNLCGKVVKYNPLLKTLHTLCDINSIHLTEICTFPFIASFAVV